ncbi:hypothetical protein ABPG77_010585 [Micractinium sp. CCAP 211/92]
MQSGQQWRGLSKAALPSAAALLEVFRSAEAYSKRGNSAGCVLQLVRVTVAAAEEPLKFGIGHGETAASVWAAAGGTSVCVSATEFPQVVFRQWLAVLQQTAARLPYGTENWETVLSVISEARRKLEGSGLPCGDCVEQVEQLVAARLAACRLREATHPKQQPLTTGGRSRRRAAVAAHAAFAVAAAAEEGMEEEAEGTGAAHRKAAAQQQQLQPGSPGSDLENMVGPANQPAGRPAAAGKRSGGTGSLESSGQHKLALQPTQAASGSSKRQRM